MPSIRDYTNSTDQELHGEEFLHDAVTPASRFEHWRAHMFSFFGWYPEPDYHVPPNRLGDLKAIISAGLTQAGYVDFADDILRQPSEEALNRALIEQYTTAGPFYREVNLGLRTIGHRTDVLTSPLAPWMLQFNAMLRLRPACHDTVYRGTTLSADDLQHYRVGEFIIWTSFVSASRDRTRVLGGNALIELNPWGAYTEYEKRDARDLSEFSLFPEEQEVIFPLCCAYRIREKSMHGDVAYIKAEVVDCA